MNKIQKLMNEKPEKKLTPEYIQHMENELGFGLNIETSTVNKKTGDKIKIHETDKDIFIDMKIKNKSSF